MSVTTTVTVKGTGDHGLLTVGDVHRFLTLCQNYGAETNQNISVGNHTSSQRDPSPDSLTVTVVTEP